MAPTTGSAATAILFCCICVVALSSSMAVAGSAAPKKPPKFISMGALQCSNITKRPSARRLVAVDATGTTFGSLNQTQLDDSSSASRDRANLAKNDGNHTRRRSARRRRRGRRPGPPGHLYGAAAPVPVCPVRFDHTRGIRAVVGSCRDRPAPSPERCCGAFKTFACPYSELINDNANNGCADDMFFQIIVRGRLQPGLFSHMCVEGPLGLEC